MLKFDDSAKSAPPIDAIAGGPIHALLESDPAAHHARAHALLRRVGDALGGRDRVRRLDVIR